MAPRSLSVGRVPHLFLEGPWETARIPLPDPSRHHLETVLRRPYGSQVTYTDGRGTTGIGTFEGERIVRGEESTVPSPRPVAVAVAPPGRSRRVRLIVEKLAELGVDRLIWLDAEHGNGRPPAGHKARSWAIAALQQSRGDRLLEIDGPVRPSDPWDADATVYVADPSGRPLLEWSGKNRGPAVVLIGPEGGFSRGEVPSSAEPISLGPRILRTETAAIVAAAMLVARR